MRTTINADAVLEVVGALEEDAATIKVAARIAINDVAAGEGLAVLRSALYDEIAFPTGYLNKDRLGVKKKARDDDLEATIAARDRPTSLARFATGDATPARKGQKTQPGVSVQVHRGRTKELKSAFLVRLRAGPSITEEKFNVGLAIRVKPGEVPRNAYRPYRLADNLFLLYGPSVAQAMREVADEQADVISGQVEIEFHRQFARLTKERVGG